MKTFYKLPLDMFNQPNGQVRAIQLTEEQYLNRDPNSYIFRNETEANRRAQQ